MKGMRSQLQIGIVTCGLSLGLLGCPQAGTAVEDGTDSGLPVAGNTGDAGTNNAGGSGDNPGGGAGVLDRSVIVRPNSPTLFVADLDKGVASFASANTLNGQVAPTAFFNTFQRFVETFRDGEPFDSMSARTVSVDRVGSLIVSSVVSTSNAADDTGLLFLRTYDEAAAVSGIPAADREIKLGSDGSLGGTAYDRNNDRLFIVVDNSVFVFEGAVLSQTGNVAPTRSFSHPDLSGASIALGPNGDLYVAAEDGFTQTVLVFANAGSRSGPASPDRVIFLTSLSGETVFVDSLDHLYVTGFNAKIAVLDKASTLNGTIDSSPVITLQNLDGLGTVQNAISGMVVDSRGIGYVAVGESGEIHIIDNIAVRSGDVRADRAIVGSDDGFGDADAIFLWE
jgi:hypothetical protein